MKKWLIPISILLCISICLNVWQVFNVKEVEKIVEVPIEVPFEVPNVDCLSNMCLVNATTHAQFGEDFTFDHGEFVSCSITFDGDWDTGITFSFCKVQNCRIVLISHGTLRLENSTITDTTFLVRDEMCLYIVGDNSFKGTVRVEGNYYVFENSTNAGLENVVFGE